MGDISRISRRAFVFGSAAIAGGVAFGSYVDAAAAATALDHVIGSPSNQPLVEHLRPVTVYPEGSDPNRRRPAVGGPGLAEAHRLWVGDR